MTVIFHFADPKREIKFTLQRDDFDRHQALFFEQLEPLKLSDILFELDVLSVSDHDNIEENPSRRRRIEILLSCLKTNSENLDYFIYALQQCKEELVLEKLENREFGEEPTEGNIFNVCVILVMLLITGTTNAMNRKRKYVFDPPIQ